MNRKDIVQEQLAIAMCCIITQFIKTCNQWHSSVNHNAYVITKFDELFFCEPSRLIAFKRFKKSNAFFFDGCKEIKLRFFELFAQ